MQIGLVGLGKMGYNLALNLHKNKFEVIAYDVATAPRKQLAGKGLKTVDSLSELVNSFSGRRLIWLMVPAGSIVDETIDAIKSKLSPNDIILDGGNSHYKESMRRAESLREKKIEYLDAERIITIILSSLGAGSRRDLQIHGAMQPQLYPRMYPAFEIDNASIMTMQ